MAGARPILSVAAIVLLAGGIVLQFFVILSGAVNSSPVNLVYFLQASTDGLSGAKSNLPNPVRWTFFALCGSNNGHNANCLPVRAALPFDPQRNFGTSQGIPDAFHGDKFYYLSRFMFAFYLIALFFAVVSFLLSVFALCARLGSYLTGFSVMLALFFQTLAASLMTAWTVEGRNIFRKNNLTASLGKYGYGFTWAAMACFLISAILFCVGGSVGKNEQSQKSSYFGRKKSTRSNRSRGSFRDSESAHRVKDEYD